MRVLQKYNNNLDDYITANKNTFMSYGSEFCPLAHLEPLLLHHRSWPYLSLQLEKGSVWPLKTLSESDRIQKNIEFISRGNNKSAITYQDVFKSVVQKKIHQGWMVPLPLHFTKEIPGSEPAPIGIDDKQFKCLPEGSKIPKYRMTHDQSFEASVGASVNTRTIRERLDLLFYGGCLSLLLHYIVALRARLHCTKILGGKSDFKSAYRIITLHGSTAVKCMILKSTQHVRDNRKEFLAHTACYVASGLPIGIECKRENDDSTAAATKRLIQSQRTPTSGQMGLPSLPNTDFAMDRAYCLLSLLYEFFLPSRADIMDIIKRSPMFPFTYDQKLS